jgi:hypothetical protein
MKLEASESDETAAGEIGGGNEEPRAKTMERKQ